MNRILVVDDDLSMRELLELMLLREGYEVRLAAGGRQALDLAAKEHFDLVITDIRMKLVDGIEVLKGVKALEPNTVVILISAFATVETAVTAMREGAYDFIPKPFNIDELKSVIETALKLRTPEDEQRVLAEKVKEGCHFGSLVGLSPAMVKVYDLVRRAAQTPTNILVSGESGTGKELVARAIHENSARAKGTFVAINCGGMPELLIESELFGHRKGAFTGASMDKQGLFELAHNGTIFLDEIGELSIPVQVKLLRVVQERTFRPVGDTRERNVDVRIIAATNKNLEREVIEGRFREDLFYRLNVINIHLPPLRQRKEDIPLLAQFFLNKYSKIMGKNLRKMSAFALDILSNYHFPGNVRELENIVERSVALEQSTIILPESLSMASFKTERRMARPPEEQLPFPKPPVEIEPSSQDSGNVLECLTNIQINELYTLLYRQELDDILDDIERYYLLKALRTANSVEQQAADLLKISNWRLRSRLAKYDLVDLDTAALNRMADETKLESAIPKQLAPRWEGTEIDLDFTLLRVEKCLLEHTIKEQKGSKTQAAKVLGISPRTLHSRLARTHKIGED